MAWVATSHSRALAVLRGGGATRQLPGVPCRTVRPAVAPAAARAGDDPGARPARAAPRLAVACSRGVLSPPAPPAALAQENKSEHNGEDFSHASLGAANFAEAELKGTSFAGADLRAAIFSRAVLYKADLSGADASNAFFDYTVLRGASVRGAVLAGANFVRADMGEMDAEDADFTDAIIDKYQVGSLCEGTARGRNPATGVDTRASLGCDALQRYSGFNAQQRVAVVDAARRR